jgi:ABC-type nitrate/sulfonate/bicarbonate transport system substrate-binding protein
MWYNFRMIKALEQAIQKVRALPEEKQQLAAELLEELAADLEPYILSPEELEAVRQGLEQANRGEFASDAEVEKLLRRSWD